MTNLRRLEQFWHNMVSQQKLTLGAEVPGAVIACWPEIPSFRLNHAADISVEDEDVEVLMGRVAKYFLLKGVHSFGFRVSPLTRPASLASSLESHGFAMQDEDSVMIFTGGCPEPGTDNLVDVKEITESEVGIFSQVSVSAYEMPSEWTEGFDHLILHRLRGGGRHYLAYVGGRPVGTCALLSSRGTGSVYSVGTLKEHRGEGIATAMTLRAVRDSFAEGNTLHTLQTEKGGYPERLYKRIGFAVDHTVAFFAKTVKG